MEHELHDYFDKIGLAPHSSHAGRHAYVGHEAQFSQLHEHLVKKGFKHVQQGSQIEHYQGGKHNLAVKHNNWDGKMVVLHKVGSPPKQHALAALDHSEFNEIHEKLGKELSKAGFKVKHNKKNGDFDAEFTHKGPTFHHSASYLSWHRQGPNPQDDEYSTRIRVSQLTHDKKGGNRQHKNHLLASQDGPPSKIPALIKKHLETLKKAPAAIKKFPTK